MEDHFLKKLTEIVEANLGNEQFGVSELAREMGMSRSNLHRKVKAVENISVSQLIRKIRLRKALELLKETGLTVSEVTWRVGFGSTSYFIKCFHDHYGFPPGEVGKDETTGNDFIEKRIPTRRNNRKIFILSAVAILVMISAVLSLVKPSFLFGRQKLEVVDNEIVLNIQNENRTEDPVKIISSRCIEILIQDAVLRAGGNPLLSNKEFSTMFPEMNNAKRIPAKEVSVKIINKDINYELIVNIADNKLNNNNSVRYSINEPNDLLTTYIFKIAELILDKPVNIKPLTSNWDAFKSYNQGVRYWDVINKIDAKIELKKAINEDPLFNLPKLKLAEIYHFETNYQNALNLLEDIKESPTGLNPVDSLRAKALENKLRGNYLEYKNNYNALQSYMPADKNLLYELAEAYFHIRDIDNAISNYKSVLVLDKKHSLAMNHMAYCYSHKGEHQLALKWFRNYVRLDSSANSFDSFSDGFFAAGKYDSARYYNLKGLEIAPDLDYLYRKSYYINLETGKIREAEKDINKYMSMQSDNEMISDALSKKAFIYFWKGNYQMAIDTCLKAKQIFDSDNLVIRNHELHWILAKSYLQLNEATKAEQEIEKMQEIIKRFNINEYNYNEIFKFYNDLKFMEFCRQNNEAGILNIIEIFDHSIDDKIKDWVSPYDKAFFNTQFGIELLKTGKTKQAIERFNTALEYNPNYAVALYYLYQINENAGKTDLAHKYQDHFNEVMENADQDFITQFAINI